VAVKWEHMDGSKVDPIKDSIRMFSDLLKIRWLHRSL
jgi:dolichyl-phosphate beta-glucosyltransferase